VRVNLYCIVVTENSLAHGRSSTHLFQKVALLILATAFLSEIAGFLTHQLNLALGAVLLLWLAITYLPLRKVALRSHRLWLGLAILISAFASLRVQPGLRPLLVSLFLLGLYQVLSSGDETARELKGMAVGTFSFGLFLIFEKHSPIVWSAIQSFSVWFSRVIGAAGGRQLSISASFTGVYITLLFLSVSVALFFSSRRKKPVSLVLLVVAFLVANGIAIALGHPLAHAMATVVRDSAEGVSAYNRILMSAPLLALCLGLIPLYVFTRIMHPTIEPSPGKVRPVFGGVGLSALLVSILILVLVAPARDTGQARIAFYREGYFNWMRPIHGEYGSRSSGMFGNLPVFAEALGFESITIDSINGSILTGVTVLFMINIDHELPAHSYEEIREFVERGGSLVMLGDHTFFKDERKNWLNAVLRPFKIKYNFDSGDYFVGGWLHSYSYPASPLTVGMSDEQNDVGSVVGASLRISYPAVPVIIGRYGFSDEGNPDDEDGGYLGNLEYDPGERLGDVILAAAQNYGKGKVLIFGDTSGFVNPLMIDTYPFVNRVLTWLASDARIPAHGPRLTLSIVFLSLFILLTSVSGFSALRFLLMPILAIVPIILSQALFAGRVETPIRGDFALVDDSHYGRYPVEFWKPHGHMGLHLNLMRKGYLSFGMRDFDTHFLNSSRLLVLIAPSKAFTSGEITALDEYVRNGGNLLMAVGYEEKGASTSLLRHFGFDIENTPLGSFYTDVPGTDLFVYFREAWPISYSGEDVEVIAGHGEYPAVVLKNHGEGRIVVFGDSGFFYNINLETEDEPLTANIEFLSWLLDQLNTPEES